MWVRLIIGWRGCFSGKCYSIWVWLTLLWILSCYVYPLLTTFLFNCSQFWFASAGSTGRSFVSIFVHMHHGGLFRLINQAERIRSIWGVKIARQAPTISSLCFADDTLLFCRATKGEAAYSRRFLDKYAEASGQVINYDNVGKASRKASIGRVI